MAIKFKAKFPQSVKIVNRCLYCGKVISYDRIICGACERKTRNVFRRK